VHRLTRGRIGRHFPGGAPVVWLTVPGRKSGVPRTTPLLGIKRPDGSWVVAGSAGGDSVEPLWSLNARAAATNPDASCSLEFAGDRWPVSVALLDDEEERSANYALLVGKWPFFRAYAERAGRLIPVFLLTPKN
jgi:deazaflavin-dependent oxidoreductase (nitroreductase family)